MLDAFEFSLGESLVVAEVECGLDEFVVLLHLRKLGFVDLVLLHPLGFALTSCSGGG